MIFKFLTTGGGKNKTHKWKNKYKMIIILGGGGLH